MARSGKEVGTGDVEQFGNLVVTIFRVVPCSDTGGRGSGRAPVGRSGIPSRTNFPICPTRRRPRRACPHSRETMPGQQCPGDCGRGVHPQQPVPWAAHDAGLLRVWLSHRRSSRAGVRGHHPTRPPPPGKTAEGAVLQAVATPRVCATWATRCLATDPKFTHVPHFCLVPEFEQWLAPGFRRGSSCPTTGQEVSRKVHLERSHACFGAGDMWGILGSVRDCAVREPGRQRRMGSVTAGQDDGSVGLQLDRPRGVEMSSHTKLNSWWDCRRLAGHGADRGMAAFRADWL